MLMTALLLAQVAAATPAPYRVETAPAQEMGVRPATGTVSNAAGRIKLNRSVSFGQDKAGTPLPTPAPLMPDGAPARAAVSPSAPAPHSAGAPDPAIEAAWRAKYKVCRDELRAAAAALAAARAANPQILNQNGHLLVLAETQRNAAISPHEARLASAEAAMASLPEDCRKGGCQPGWLRD